MNPISIAKDGEPSANHSWFARLVSEVPMMEHSPNPATMSPGWKIQGWLDKSDLFENIHVLRYHVPINWAGREEDGILDGPHLGKLMCTSLLVSKSFILFRTISPVCFRHFWIP